MTDWITSASVLILLVVGMRYLFQGKISLKLQYALWLFVAIRLLLPISFGDSVLSVENVTNELKVQTYHVENNTINHLDGNVEDTYEDIVQKYENLDKWNTQNQLTYLSSVSWKKLVYSIWFLGAILLGLIFITSNLRFGLKIKKERKQIVVDGVKVPIYISTLIDTPCLMGFFMPSIYVTKSVVNNSILLRHSIMHEMTHYRHGDSLWGLIRCICLVIHWYNPLVWWAAILSKRDAELACDEATIQKLGEEERAEYGKTLLYLSCEKKQNLFVMTTTMTSGKKSIKERILLIAKKPKITKYALLFFIFLAGVAIGCTFTKAKESQENKEILEENTENNGQVEPTEIPAGEPMVIPSFGEEPINIPTPEVTPLPTIEQSMASQKDTLEDELERLQQEAKYYEKAEKDKVCLAVMPDGISLAGGDYRYLIPEDQEYWLAEYKKMVSIASEGGWEEGELSNGIWIVYQDEWTHLTNQGFIVDFSKRVNMSEALEFYQLCMEEARKNGTGTPIRPEEIKDISSATLNYNGTYTITDKTILVKEIEHYFSQSTEIRGGAACTFTAPLTIELENGAVMTIFLATDSCSVWLSDGVYYEYSGYENIEQIFWLFSSMNN